MPCGDHFEIARSYLKKLEDLMAWRSSHVTLKLSSPDCGHPWVLITYDRMFCLASKKKVLGRPWYLHHYIGPKISTLVRSKSLTHRLTGAGTAGWHAGHSCNLYDVRGMVRGHTPAAHADATRVIFQYTVNSALMFVRMVFGWLLAV